MAAQRTRITGGTARGVPLRLVPGTRTRPTSSRLREAIFNVLADRVRDASVADLFAGTGALGIEALSRGAREATFFESGGAACRVILQNLSATGFAGAGTVIRGRLPDALTRQEERFDIIFLDPPYGVAEAEETLVAAAVALEEGGQVVYEHGSRYNPPEHPTGLALEQTRVYGDSAISIYRQEQ
jgi:16S rRNA (guanine(966)-N(2))-methyltransferase RsmD